MFSFL